MSRSCPLGQQKVASVKIVKEEEDKKPDKDKVTKIIAMMGQMKADDKEKLTKKMVEEGF